MTQQFVTSLLLAIVGQAGAGKTSLTKELVHHLNASHVSFGSFVREEAVNRGLPIDRPTLQSLGQQLIEQFGSEAFARRVVMTASGPHDTLIVDGVRSIAVWQAIQELAQASVLIYLDIPTVIRRNRIISRDKQSSDAVQKIMKHPLETQVPDLMSYADIVLSQGDAASLSSHILNYLSERGLLS